MNASLLAETSNHTWFTSSYSNGAGGECVECAPRQGGMLVRDSKRPHTAELSVSTMAWAGFVGAVRSGGFVMHSRCHSY
ncbi:DUF397 domain-containing protein [Streptomyces sp. NBC_01267]|uniref:DUF397 domain-containing protein n=1 Tax=unclassified Streptomyces TaxID=2593676 RepID=UPI002E301578|nr:DUF397 domain-containing protein [Streptomyces sp. NBC_01267]